MLGRLTVVQRIGAGFGVVTVLLLAVGLTGLVGQASMKSSMVNVSDATQLSNQSQAVLVSLLEIGRSADSYHATTETAELADLEARYAASGKRITQLRKELTGLGDDDPEIKSASQAFGKEIAAVQGAADALFNSHKQYAALFPALKRGRGQLEDTADEMDGAIADALDAGGNPALLNALRKQIKLSINTATKVLDQKKLESARIAAKDMQPIAESLSNSLDQLGDGKAVADVAELLGDYVSLLKGDKALLALHIKALEQDAQSVQALTQLDQRIEATRKQLDAVVALAGERVAAARKAADRASTFGIAAIVIMGLAALVVAGLVAVWVTNSIRQPLSRVMAQLRRLAQGDMTQLVMVDSRDEFGELGRSTNELTERLRSMLVDIANDAVTLARASEQSTSIAVQTSASIEHQRHQTDTMAQEMSAMSESVRAVAEGAERTLSEVRSARDMAERGQTVVESNLHIIEGLASNIASTADVVSKLDEYSNDIGRILTVISEIADQTNLLALNAAIEAARAGEQGRGFAVVADEVRTLASRTRQSTGEIHSVINRLQEGVGDVVKAMRASREGTKSSVSQAHEAGRALEAILSSMRQVDTMSGEIAKAAETQNLTTRQLHQGVLDVSTIAEQTARGATQTAESSRELAKLAERLQRQVSQFQVSR
ncbi:methyl-accepting chemotaxis protein [Chitinimonas sp. BJYL2]|uniref:methyl-accepting chemotaxis protein n=1 Tax=Chitinimonas sp. BJYL2 TaxID=2976696 RepID=UPI0022B38332|nr:methyl-accepting chemotaxis protein [Chitinimonas sp. BJYL2]